MVIFFSGLALVVDDGRGLWCVCVCVYVCVCVRTCVCLVDVTTF